MRVENMLYSVLSNLRSGVFFFFFFFFLSRADEARGKKK